MGEIPGAYTEQSETSKIVFQLFRKHEDELRHYARSMAKNNADTDDLMQQMQEKLLRAIVENQIDLQKLNPGYFKRILKNLHIDQLRSNERKKRGNAAYEEVSSLDEKSPDTPEKLTETKEQVDKLRALLEVLGSTEDDKLLKQAMELHYIDGKSEREVAATMGKPRSTIQGYLRQGREFLQEHL